MKLSFTTLGCPAWDLETVLARAKEYGFAGIDFRGLKDVMDVTTLPAFTTDLGVTAERIRKTGLEVSGISSSIVVCDPGRRAQNLDEARRTLAVARGLGCRHVRVFGGGDPAKVPRPELAAAGAECLRAILELEGAREVQWCFETHDHWVAVDDVMSVLGRVPDAEVGILWDIAHSSHFAVEKPEDTVKALASRIRYTHVKDGRNVPDANGEVSWNYVAPGTGEIPLEASVRLLKKAGYDGWLVFEHEKRWIPALPEPEVAFPQYVSWARRFL